MDTQHKTYGKVTRSFILAYGLISYLIFFVTFLYAIGFLGGFLVPTSLDGLADTNTWQALAIDLGLLSLFAIQHSVMARPAFKRWWTQFIPQPLERSTYVLATALVFFVLIYYWQPMQGSLWHVESEAARTGIAVIYFIGWAITLLATFMLNHFHLFGLQQSFRSEDPDAGSKEFKTPFFYSMVRHPIQTGVVIGMLATPDMTVSRAVLAISMLVYIGVGLYYEERDLIGEFGDTYLDYKKRVPALIPLPKSKGD